MRVLGVDIGTKRVGLALGETESSLAAPWKTLDVLSPLDAVAQISSVVHHEAVGCVVVGDPLGMDGSATPQTNAVRQIVALLTKEIAPIPVIAIDERLSSKLADQQMLPDAQGGRDAYAASVILESYLAQQK